MTKINSDSKDSNNQMNCYELIKMFNQLLVLWKPAGCDDDDNGLAAVHSLCRLAIIISRSVYTTDFYSLKCKCVLFHLWLAVVF
jgi:hypothetical protein